MLEAILVKQGGNAVNDATGDCQYNVFQVGFIDKYLNRSRY